MATGRCAPDADAICITFVARGRSSQETHRGFAIVNLRWPGHDIGKAILDAGDNEALSHKAGGGTAFFVAALPPAAVNPDDEWSGYIGKNASPLPTSRKVLKTPRDLHGNL